MKAMEKIVVAVGLVVISAMAPVVKAQQGVEKAAPGTMVAPAEALNSLLNITESQMLSLVKAFPADKYGFAPSAAIFAPGQQTEYAGVRTFGTLVIHVAQANYILGSRLSGLKPDIDPTTQQLAGKSQSLKQVTRVDGLCSRSESHVRPCALPPSGSVGS